MVSILKTDKIQASHGSTIEIPTGHILHAPGMVIQTVYANYMTQSSTTSTSFQDSGLTATITPHFATSKINVFVTGNAYTNASGNGNYRIVRGSTSIYNTDYAPFSQGDAVAAFLAMNVQDSPNTTSATVYKVMYRSDNGALVYFNVNDDFLNDS